MNDENSIEEGFYKQVANILGIESNYRPVPFSRRTRWNNRSPGNGRFLGHGIIRRFSSEHIHVQLYFPIVNGMFKNELDVLNAIRLAQIK